MKKTSDLRREHIDKPFSTPKSNGMPPADCQRASVAVLGFCAPDHH